MKVESLLFWGEEKLTLSEAEIKQAPFPFLYNITYYKIFYISLQGY